MAQATQRVCKQCGHRWRWIKCEKPQRCRACRSRLWNKPKPPELAPEVIAELERCIAKALRVKP